MNIESFHVCFKFKHERHEAVWDSCERTVEKKSFVCLLYRCWYAINHLPSINPDYKAKVKKYGKVKPPHISINSMVQFSEYHILEESK